MTTIQVPASIKDSLFDLWKSWRKLWKQELEETEDIAKVLPKKIKGFIRWTPENGPEVFLDGNYLPRMRDVTIQMMALGPNATITLRELVSGVGAIQLEALLRLQKFSIVEIDFEAEEQELVDF